MQQAEPQLEEAIIQTLWQESADLGASYGLKLLERAGLIAEDFADETGKRLFTHLRESVTAGKVPIVSPMDSEGREYLQTSQIRPVTKLDAMTDRLKTLTTKRALKRLGADMARLADESELSPAELVARAQAAVKAIPARSSHWDVLTPDNVDAHIRAIAEGKTRGAVPTGFEEIDKATGGLPPTLIVIVAMPGVGKSAWVGAVIKNIAARGEKVALFSMEDHSDWMAFRFLAHESGVPQGILRHKPLRDDQWESVGAVMSRLKALGQNILVDNRANLTPAEVLSASRDAIHKGAKVVFLDNMTAMRFPRGERRDLEFQDFLCAVREMANETGVPFVAISHAKRREGLDVDELPQLTDCAESSAYEKLCRLAYGLARNKTDNTLKIGVLKNTNGRAWVKFKLQLRPESALVEQDTPTPKAWGWSHEVENGTF